MNAGIREIYPIDTAPEKSVQCTRNYHEGKKMLPFDKANVIIRCFGKVLFTLEPCHI